MYTKEQKERTLKEFERLGSVQAVVTLLGYSSKNGIIKICAVKKYPKFDFVDGADKVV